MNNDKARLLKAICDHLKLDDIPQSMVSRRLTVFKAFEENEDKFHGEEFRQWFWNIYEEGHPELTEGKITPSLIFSFINSNYDLVEEALKLDSLDEALQTHEEMASEISEEFKAIILRNKTQRILAEDSLFMKKLLGKAKSEIFPYPEFEKRILNHFEKMLDISGRELLEEASKAYIWNVYKEDETKCYRLIFEEFIKHKETYEKLGVNFSYPEMSLGGGRNVSQIMEAIHRSFTQNVGGILGLRRIISIANRIAEVGFTEEEIINFFTAYLSGGLDSTLSNPPDGHSYFIEVIKTYDYDFTTNLDNLAPKTEFNPKELETTLDNFLRILIRIKIAEWSKNVPMGEEITIIDLITEIQKDVLNQIEDEEKLLPFFEMFQKTDKNILETTITHFSKELAYSYILRLRRGGVESTLLNSFKIMNLSGASKTIGNQIFDIKKFYETLYPDSWQIKFYDEFILDIASKGLSTSSKQTVRERLNLLVQESPGYSGSSAYKLKKIELDVIFENLKINVPLVLPDFGTAEEAQKYISRTFSIIRSVLSKVWIKKILRTGFELYIESPVKRVWQNEMEDLSRELVSYYQNVVTVLGRKSSEINELVVEGLRDSLSGLYFVDENVRDSEVFNIFVKLPENPILTDRDDVENYLDFVFDEGKLIINKVLSREVKEEIERKTFDQEIEERISLENTVIDWFVRASQYYNSIITELISLEKTTDPNDTLLKTIYGGTIFLVEESMKSLLLNQNEKINKASFLKIFFLKQVEALRSSFSQLKFDYNTQAIINYVLAQIRLWDRVFRLRGILSDLEADNRMRRALGPSVSDSHEDSRIASSLVENPGLRGLIAREFMADWIKNWANSVIELTESYLEEVLPNVEETEKESFEQEVLGLLFNGTGRDDIRNFMVPLIVGNLKKPLGYETSPLPPEFSKYRYEVFAEAVKCDSQLSIYFLFSNWVEKERKYFKKQVVSDLDFVIYQESQIVSCRRLLGATQEFTLSDVVKKATGLSLSGLTLQTVVFQLGEKEIYSAASYVENPFEGSIVTGLTLELISKENIPMGLIHPLAKNASEAIAGLIERNQLNASEPDILFNAVLQQLLNEARLVLLKDAGTLSERIATDEMAPQIERDVSRCNLKVTTAYKMYFKDDLQDQSYRLEEVEFYGEKLDNFGLFVQLIIPFLEPSQIIRKRLKKDHQLLDYLEVPKGEEIRVFPSLIIFDDNDRYKVAFGTYSSQENALYVLVAEENDESKMGLRTIQYLLKTRDFEELSEDLGLLPLPRLNQSLPLNRINVMKEKRGEYVIDFELIKNISLGAI
ncbi:MAG: hypothetical protein JSW11_19905 [Candidatus Heimdallarchaeota archaeon]|nr:MAG: hypothetical protein JSW11_19905 [Candidatus Heimdallarchaeota archaeon]